MSSPLPLLCAPPDQPQAALQAPQVGIVCPQRPSMSVCLPRALLGCDLHGNDRGTGGEWQLRVLGFVNSEGISESVTGTAALWGPAVLRLSLLLCEQFISFTDRQLLTSHSPEDEMSCLIRFKLVLSLAFPINKLSLRCHYSISIF